MKICVKLLIVRYHFIIITLSKPHLVCTVTVAYYEPAYYEHSFIMN